MPANKTSFKSGVSGNPKGRPPKCRALTDILASAGNTKATGFDGKPEARKKILAEMVWNAALSCQVRFLVDNRTDSLARGPRAVERVDELTPGAWWAIVTWLYHQIDGDLSVTFQEKTGAGEEDGPATGGDEPPVLYMPDNGREPPQKLDAEDETTSEKDGDAGAPEAGETQSS